MTGRSFLATLALAMTLVLALGGCAAQQPAGEPEPLPAVEQPVAGSRLAPGLYDLEDGTVQALGTLGRSELEGGFWQIVGGTEAEGNVGEVVAVIANADEFSGDLERLDGKTVLATGTRFEGASTRMAGPEIVLSAIEEISDTPGAAE